MFNVLRTKMRQRSCRNTHSNDVESEYTFVYYIIVDTIDTWSSTVVTCNIKNLRKPSRNCAVYLTYIVLYYFLRRPFFPIFKRAAVK